jgi:hypothetical protein
VASLPAGNPAVLLFCHKLSLLAPKEKSCGLFPSWFLYALDISSLSDKYCTNIFLSIVAFDLLHNVFEMFQFLGEPIYQYVLLGFVLLLLSCHRNFCLNQVLCFKPIVNFELSFIHGSVLCI